MLIINTMEALHFSDFQKELTEKEYKNPKIRFGFNSVTLTTLPYFDDILGMTFIWTISIYLCFSPALFWGITFFIISWYFFYFQFAGLGICKIDVLNKTITIRNRIFIFNILRNLFGIKTEILISDLKEISYKEGLLLSRFSGYRTRYLLLIESFSDPAIITLQFKTEEQAKDLVAILRKFLLNNKKIIA